MERDGEVAYVIDNSSACAVNNLTTASPGWILNRPNQYISSCEKSRPPGNPPAYFPHVVVPQRVLNRTAGGGQYPRGQGGGDAGAVPDVVAADHPKDAGNRGGGV